MSLRGVRARGSTTVTSALHGLLRDDSRSRAQLFALARARPQCRDVTALTAKFGASSFPLVSSYDTNRLCLDGARAPKRGIRVEQLQDGRGLVRAGGAGL